jgi:ATP-dependent DNA helicase RecG
VPPTYLDTALDGLGRGRPASAFESDHLEFKEPAESVKKTLSILAETAVCLSNAEGGVIVLGVNDKATRRPDALVGASAAQYPLDEVRRGVFDRTAPPLTLIAEERLVESARLVVLHGPRVPGPRG